MSEQKVVICKDLKSELQDFLSSLKYDKLFILMAESDVYKIQVHPYGYEYQREMFSLGRGYTGLSKGADSRDGSG